MKSSSLPECTKHSTLYGKTLVQQLPLIYFNFGCSLNEGLWENLAEQLYFNYDLVKWHDNLNCTNYLSYETIKDHQTELSGQLNKAKKKVTNFWKITKTIYWKLRHSCVGGFLVWSL